MPVRIPTYQQRTTGAEAASVPQPKASPIAIRDRTPTQVLGVAEDMAKIGNQMAQAQARVQAKQEAIFGVRANSALTLEGEDQLRTMMTTDDFADPSSVATYNQFLRERKAQILSSYQGSEEGRLNLSERMEQTRFTLLGKASTASAAAQNKLVEDTLGQRLGALSAQVRQNPASILNAFEQLDTDISDMSMALTPDQERARREAGRANITESAFDWFMEQGLVNDAERLLNDTPGVVSALGPEKHRALANRIGQARAVAMKEKNGLTVKGIPLEVFNKLNWTEQRRVMGALPTDDSRPFGESLAGISLEMMSRDTPAFANRQMTPTQERQYIAAVQNYIQPSQFFDPATGQTATRRNEVPSYVADAFKARGINLASPAGAGAGTRDMPTPEQAEIERNLLAGVPTGLFEGGRTIVEMGNVFTGPLPAVMDVIGRTPGLGVGASEVNEARTNIKITFKRLVSALQQNPRFNEGERKAIAADLEVEPKIWDNEASFIERMVGIDRALEGYQRDAERALGGTISMERRRHEMDTLQTIQAFRSKLMPTRLENDQQIEGFVKSAQPGTPFVAKDENGKWTTYRKK